MSILNGSDFLCMADKAKGQGHIVVFFCQSHQLHDALGGNRVVKIQL